MKLTEQQEKGILDVIDDLMADITENAHIECNGVEGHECYVSHKDAQWIMADYLKKFKEVIEK